MCRPIKRVAKDYTLACFLTSLFYMEKKVLMTTQLAQYCKRVGCMQMFPAKSSQTEQLLLLKGILSSCGKPGLTFFPLSRYFTFLDSFQSAFQLVHVIPYYVFICSNLV